MMGVSEHRDRARRDREERTRTTVADDWRTPDTDAERFLRDLCTLGELHDMAQRWAVVRLLDAGMHYAEISRRTGASTATITRIASWLNHGEGGYREMLERFKGGDGSTPYPLGVER
jgi:TrpR-related protein YerC/YecD